jgi:flavin-dependent dehydrogenase
MKYEVAIIGGGLAGLSLAIDLKRRGYSVVVVEKGNYPRHKVCGEYISMESYNYLHSICPALTSLSLPHISNFKLSSTGKYHFQTKLDLGGFGISRYLLEELLFEEAKKNGVIFMLKCKAFDSETNEWEEGYTLKTNSGDVKAIIICNATGRKSNFDNNDRETHLSGTNYIGVKYHVRLQRDDSFVEIHNFPGGYCGLSGIEENKSCICYIVNAKRLNSVQNSISELEKVYLFQNSNLKQLFSEAEFLYKEPLTISGINFRIKKPATDSAFFLGDSAGSIAPVTGNGMSNACRAAALLTNMIDAYFSNSITKQQLIDNYTDYWKKEFSTRLKLSRHFQKLSEYPLLTNLSIGLFKSFPSVAKSIIMRTHGSSYIS